MINRWMRTDVGAQNFVPSSYNVNLYQKIARCLGDGFLSNVKFCFYRYFLCGVEFGGTKFCAPTSGLFQCKFLFIVVHHLLGVKNLSWNTGCSKLQWNYFQRLSVGAQNFVPSGYNVNLYQKIARCLGDGLLGNIRSCFCRYFLCGVEFGGTRFCTPTSGCMIVGAQHVVPSSYNVNLYQKIVRCLGDGLLSNVKFCFYRYFLCGVEFGGTKFCAPTSGLFQCKFLFIVERSEKRLGECV